MSADAFAGASRKEKYRYTSVAKAIEDGTVKVPACRECLRRGTAADLADCKAVGKGRCARCLWSRVPVSKGCGLPGVERSSEEEEEEEEIEEE